jgi:CRP-like cAMP-binding protein
MAGADKLLEDVQMFAHLTKEERREIEELGSVRTYEPGAIVYEEGDKGESMFIVVEGAVELVTTLQEDVEKPLITIRENSCFGIVELLDPRRRTVTARSLKPTRALEISWPSLKDFMEREPGGGINVLLALAVGLANQMRTAIGVLRQNLAWTLEATAATSLNLQSVISDSVQINIELTNGNRVSGVLLKVEAGAAGHELIVRTDEDSLCMVPYHAVMTISFASRDLDISHGAESLL